MSSYRRPRVPGATIFFTVCLARRGERRLVAEIDALRDAVRRTRAERPFDIVAWVVLPDHLHAVWTLPEGDSDYSTRWSVIKARFSRSVEGGSPRSSHIARRERGIWQRRFWDSHIRSEEHLQAAIRYCWMNPVKHGLAPDPAAWPYSSFHRDAIGWRADP